MDADSLLDATSPGTRDSRDGTLLGALFESIVTLTSRLRPGGGGQRQAPAHCLGSPRVDLIVERADGRIIAIEVKLTRDPRTGYPSPQWLQGRSATPAGRDRYHHRQRRLSTPRRGRGSTRWPFSDPEREWPELEAPRPDVVRDNDALYREVYPEPGHPDGNWQELREFYCPISGRLLETEAVPPGYPVMHEYLPDIEGFYKGWLGREIRARSSGRGGLSLGRLLNLSSE